MKTIEQILKECENIYKPIGKDPEQDRINSNRIAGRYCIDAIQKWIDVEQELPKRGSWNVSANVLVKISIDVTAVAFYDYDTEEWTVEHGSASIRNGWIVSWRPIQYE